MESDRLTKNYEQEKPGLDRKRKAAYLESIFENASKRVSQEHGTSVKNGPLLSKDSGRHNGGVTHVSECGNAALGNGASSHRDDKDRTNITSESQQMRTASNHSNTVAATERQAEPTSDSNHYTSFQTAGRDTNSRRTPPRGHNQKTSELTNTVIIKQEKTSDSMPVQIVSVHSHHKQKPESEENGGVTDDHQKFLLFAGKLYHCERVSDLTHNFSRYGMEGIHNRKGKVVVLLLFHKVLREVVNYVVGVVDHATLEEQRIVMKIIKSHTFTSSYPSAKEIENKTSSLTVGSKKLLYNLQPLQGSISNELVRILDGFGANSVVDHSKITEFNAMINANSDRVDAQLAIFLSNLSNSFVKASSTKTSVTPSFVYLSSGISQNNVRCLPLTNRTSVDNHYSPGKSHGQLHGTTSERTRSNSARSECENGYSKSTYTSHGRASKYDTPVDGVTTNQTVRVSPKTYNTNVVVTDHFRATTSTGIPVPSSIRFHANASEGSVSSQRRNIEDLQTVAELCKEKMKRDMAEQELKTIKAAFEEFKAQMQHHLSQVEERMVLLEAENRNLKGKLSNMHQTNEFSEKKYHELRNRLEELLKSI